MANLFNWVEIPTSDMVRAKTFYRTIEGAEKELLQKNFGDLLYAFLPMEGDGIGGALVQHMNYVPGQGQGVCVYLLVQGDLNATLAKVESRRRRSGRPQNASWRRYESRLLRAIY